MGEYSPPTAADYAANDARNALHEIRRQQKQIEELRKQMGELEGLVKMLAAALEGE